MEENRDTVLEGLGDVRRHTAVVFVDSESLTTVNTVGALSPTRDLGISLSSLHSHTSFFFVFQ
jgi:hypothetical protein